MARKTEKQSTRFLVVTEKVRTPLKHKIHQRLTGMGLNGFEDMTPAPQARQVVIPRNRGLGINLRHGEAQKVAQAMEEMGQTTFQGTDILGYKWHIDDVKIDRKGRARVTGLGRWMFGWDTAVKRAHKKNVKEAQRDLARATHTDGKSTRHKENPVKQSLKRENAEAKMLQAVDASATVHGWQGWRAKGMALIAEANPYRSAEGKSSRFLKPGQSRGETYGQLHTMMLQVADAQLDPADKIHGPFEGGVKLLQRFQRGAGGAILSAFAGDIPLFTKGTNAMVTGNKVASRDARSELTVRGIARVARRLLVIDKYGKFYGKQGFVGRLIFPADSLVEQAADRRMQRGNIAKLAKTEATLLTPNVHSRLGQMHQRIVAEEFVKAYNAPSPLIEILTESAYKNIDGAVENTTKTTKNAVEKVVSQVEKGLPKFLRRRPKDDQNGQPVNPREDLRKAIEAYGDKPMSTADQVAALLAHADSVLTLPLTPIERARWTIAREYALRFARLEQAAQAVVTVAPETSARRVTA